MSFVCSIPLIASLFASCAGPAPLAVGYVEGEYVLLAPIEVAGVETVSVRRGDRVSAGDAVAALETSDTTIAAAQAAAALAQAEAQLADLKIGKRPEEIAVLEATLVSAQAQEEEADRVLARLADLLKRGIATQADYDQAKTALDVATAMVGQSEANLAVAKLPARRETINAADYQVKQARAALEQAEWRLSKRTISAPDLPTMAEVGYPGFEAVPWFGLLAPAGTPQPIIDKVHLTTVKVLAMPDVRKKFTDFGLDVIGSSPSEFSELIKTEIPQWAKIIKEAGIKASE